MSSIITRNPDFWFIHIPKNGGTSITRSVNGSDKFQNADFIVPEAWLHYDAQTVVSVMGHDWAQNAESFTIMRNPWSRLWSWYNFRLETAKKRIDVASSGLPTKYPVEMDLRIVREMEDLGFNRWIQTTDLHADKFGLPIIRKSQLSWLKVEDQIVVKHILFLEDLDRSRLASFGIHVMGHQHKSTYATQYRDAYDKEGRAFVDHYFEEDISFGNYSF